MNRGFTIVELLVVIAAIALLSVVTTLGTTTVVNNSRNSEASSKLSTIKSALERYYNDNNEYPSAQLLAGGGNGRALSTPQYGVIAGLLNVNIDVLNAGQYKFVPCISGTTACAIAQSDNKFIMYLTRTASDVSSGVQRIYTTPSSSCEYRFPVPSPASEAGYTAYYLVYRDPSDSAPFTQWKVVQSDRGVKTRGTNCPVTV